MAIKTAPEADLKQAWKHLLLALKDRFKKRQEFRQDLVSFFRSEKPKPRSRQVKSPSKKKKAGHGKPVASGRKNVLNTVQSGARPTINAIR